MALSVPFFCQISRIQKPSVTAVNGYTALREEVIVREAEAALGWTNIFDAFKTGCVAARARFCATAPWRCCDVIEI